jgi:ribosomal protein L7Ae-like RNA K-turn-binding protein
MGLQNLGLCKAARKLVVGEDFTVEAIRNGSCHLVFLASDASKNTTKKIKDKSSYYKVEVIDTYTSNELSQAIGEANRMVIGITDRGFAKILKK